MKLKEIFKKKSKETVADDPNYIDVVLSLDNENHIFFKFYRGGEYILYENLTSDDKETATQLLIQGTSLFARVLEQSKDKDKKHLS